MERQASHNGLPHIDRSSFPTAPWRPNPPHMSSPEAKPAPITPKQEDYEAFFHLLFASTEVHRHVSTYMLRELPHDGNYKPFPSLSFYRNLYPIEASANEAKEALNAYAARIGGLPVRYALEDGEELVGRVTEWREYAGTSWKVTLTREGETTSESGNFTVDQLVTGYVSATARESDMIEECPVDDIPAEF